MPYNVFDKRLYKQHGNIRLGLIFAASHLDVKMKRSCEADLFQSAIGFEHFDLFIQWNPLVVGVFQDAAGQIGEFEQIRTGFFIAVGLYGVVDGIEAIEDEMRVHLCAKGGQFQHRELLLDAAFARFAVEYKDHKEKGHYKRDQSKQRNLLDGLLIHGQERGGDTRGKHLARQ
jgi:hypothetical protein